MIAEGVEGVGGGGGGGDKWEVIKPRLSEVINKTYRLNSDWTGFWTGLE